MKNNTATRLADLAEGIDADEQFVDDVMRRVRMTAPITRPRSASWTGLRWAAAAIVLIGLGTWMGSAIERHRNLERAQPGRVEPVKVVGAVYPRERLLSLEYQHPGSERVGVVLAASEQWQTEDGIVLILSPGQPSEALLKSIGVPLFATQLTPDELNKLLKGDSEDAPNPSLTHALAALTASDRLYPSFAAISLQAVSVNQ